MFLGSARKRRQQAQAQAGGVVLQSPCRTLQARISPGGPLVSVGPDLLAVLPIISP